MSASRELPPLGLRPAAENVLQIQHIKINGCQMIWTWLLIIVKAFSSILFSSTKNLRHSITISLYSSSLSKCFQFKIVAVKKCGQIVGYFISKNHLYPLRYFSFSEYYYWGEVLVFVCNYWRANSPLIEAQAAASLLPTAAEKLFLQELLLKDLPLLIVSTSARLA